jgi:hypothetical protein
MRTKFLLKSLKGKNHAEDQAKREDNIKMDLREKVLEGVDWIHLAHDRDRWRALKNTVMNLSIPYKTGNLTS